MQASESIQAKPPTFPDNAAVDLYLVRHGNAKKLQGETYVTAPLTELGRRQATRTGEYLEQQGILFDGYYCSALKRAIDTATLIGEQTGQKPSIRSGIQEMEYREIPATLAAELVARTGMLDRYFQERIGKAIRFPMIGRVAEGMMSILAQHDKGRLGVVAHGGVISSVLAWYFPGERRRWWRETVGNCSITRIQVANGRATLIEMDQITHLGDLAATAHLRNYTFTGDEGV